MKRQAFVFIFLLSVILIAYAESERLAPTTVAPVSQKEISAKLDELEARAADLQAQLNVSHEILQNRGQLQ